VQSCFSNTDAYVLSGSEDGKLFIWSLGNARFSILKIDVGEEPWCPFVSYSLFVAEDGMLVYSAQAHKGRVSTLSYHPDRTMLRTSTSFD